MKPKPPPSKPSGFAEKIFALLVGVFIGLGLLKFCNPPIMEKYLTSPADIWEFVFGGGWPLAWAYVSVVLLGVFGLVIARWKIAVPAWVALLPLGWLLWQWLSTAGSLDSSLSTPTVQYFTACVGCFYLGLFSLSRCRSLGWFWAVLLGAFLLVLADGWYQHFGGLEQTRRYFEIYELPRMKEVPPELLKRMTSTRISSTLFYPNALAGALLLLLPPLLAAVALAKRQFTTSARGFILAVLIAGALACLFWSGSKGGWLLALMLGVIGLLQLRMSKVVRTWLLCFVVFMGLAGFFVRYSGFFQKGATSVTARFDYWRAAAQTAAEHPVLGTGPGTFLIPYTRIKRPESEPARLVHNDYLEQASDSGVPGALLYLAFVGSVFFWSRPWIAKHAAETQTYPGASSQRTDWDWQRTWVWLGVLGWALQGFMEFGLYVPALAFPSFLFMGWLLGTRHQAALV